MNICTGAWDRRDNRTVDPFFHLVASAFSLEVLFGQHTPEDRIRELRGQGLSVSEVAKTTGTTSGVVRRIVGKLDPSHEAQRRIEQETTAKRIEAEGGTWSEKVKKWEQATGTTGTTFWRVLKRCATSS